MRTVVLGASGQLGQELLARLSGEVVPLDRTHIDLSDPGAVQPTLDDLTPDVVVNCAAYNLVDRAETEPQAAFAVNAFGVRQLALWCSLRNRPLVHFSTDHVFGRNSACTMPWTESATPEPVSVYGTSKLAGECFVRAICPQHLLIRTCGLYGKRGQGGKGTNFVATMLRLAERGTVRVVADQVCTPTAAADLAERTVELLRVGARGLFHVTNAGACSWREFAEEIFRAAGLGVTVVPITSAEYGAAARRPAYSVLSSEASSQLGLAPLRPWQEALRAYLVERKK